MSPRVTTTSTITTTVAADLLQQRVALLGAALAWLSALPFGGRFIWAAATGHFERFARPDYWLGVLGVAVPLSMWLVCRRGKRSRRFVLVYEGVAMVLGVGIVAHIARLGNELALQAVTWNMDRSAFSDVAWGGLAALVQYFTGTAVILVLGFVFALRAAFVPSGVRHTALLTGIVALPLIFVVGLGAGPFGADTDIGAASDQRMALVASTIVWWTIVTLVCTAISKVVYDLRQEVSAAQQLGQYTLENKIGEGGMGVVYRARHALLRRPTAIKLVSPDKAGAATLERFEREVQATAELTHPNTITIFDYGRTPDGVLYYAMELLDGATLDAVVELGGAQPVSRVVETLIGVADALAEAHETGLVHRDIKPANIFLCALGGHQDVPKLLDFGLVKTLQQDQDSQLTREGVVTGTPQYMAPEAVSDPEAVDARSDLYALGAVAYYMLTGRHVFEGKNIVEVCAHHLHTAPTPPSEHLDEPLPEALESLVLACLAKDPEERPQTAREMVHTLRTVRHGLLAHWGHDEAQAWWSQHGKTARGPLAQAGPTATTRTLAVDLGRTRD